MRKHHTRWVALFGAAAIATSGLVGLPAAASAADRDDGGLSWPVVRQGISSYSLDGFEIGYLPPGLERYGINASSTTDRQGARQSQISWVQGPDQLYGRVTITRSERVQELDDLREGRYSHLADKNLERLAAGEGFEREAYLSESTGDLFWLERPGVAVTTHLQPERWDRAELVEMAGSVTEEGGSQEAPAAQAPEGAAQEAPAEEAPAEEAPAQEAPAEAGAQQEAPVGEGSQQEAPVGEAPAGEAPAGQAPAEEAAQAPAAEEPAAEAPVTGPAAPEEAGTPAGGQDTAPEALTEEAPQEEAPAAEEAAPVGDPGEPQAPGAPAEGAEAPAGNPAQTPAGTPEAAELPEGVGSREVKECVIDRFVDFETGESGLDESQLTPAGGEFVERALTKDQLTEDDRDQLLATVWHYGEEGAKTGAVVHCADALGLENAQVEAVIGEIADRVGELLQGSGQEAAPGVEQVADEGAQEDAAAGADSEPFEPVDAQEWEELWASLPWSIEAGGA